MRIARNHKQMSTHMPMLIKCVQMTDGDVCELGSGFNSTPLLHWLTLGRKLITYESDKEYFHYANKFRTANHRIREMHEIDYDKHWSVVLVDHACKPPHSRAEDAKKFKDVDLMILHDSEDPVYEYEKVYPLYKYRYDYKDAVPNTTVLSNKIDVTKWQS